MECERTPSETSDSYGSNPAVWVDDVSNEPVSGRVFSAILAELGLPMLNKAPALWTIIWDLVAEGSL